MGCRGNAPLDTSASPIDALSGAGATRLEPPILYAADGSSGGVDGPPITAGFLFAESANLAEEVNVAHSVAGWQLVRTYDRLMTARD